jgi:hypothetical protein
MILLLLFRYVRTVISDRLLLAQLEVQGRRPRRSLHDAKSGQTEICSQQNLGILGHLVHNLTTLLPVECQATRVPRFVTTVIERVSLQIQVVTECDWLEETFALTQRPRTVSEASNIMQIAELKGNYAMETRCQRKQGIQINRSQMRRCDTAILIVHTVFVSIFSEVQNG